MRSPPLAQETYIVHTIRKSLDCASRKGRKLVAQALRPINVAASLQTALGRFTGLVCWHMGRRVPADRADL